MGRSEREQHVTAPGFFEPDFGPVPQACSQRAIELRPDDPWPGHKSGGYLSRTSLAPTTCKISHAMDHLSGLALYSVSERNSVTLTTRLAAPTLVLRPKSGENDNMIHRRILALACTAFSAVCGCRAQTPTRVDESASLTARQLLDRADDELIRDDVKQYAATLKVAFAAKGTDEDHSSAAVALANYYWRIEKQDTIARKILSEASSGTWPAPSLELARMELADGSFQASRDAALAAASKATAKQDLRRAHTLFAGAVSEEILRSMVDGHSVTDSSSWETQVRDAIRLIEPHVSDDSGLRSPSRLALFLALWSNRGSVALQSWDSYYRLPSNTDAPPPLTAAGKALHSLLPALRNESSAAVRTQVVDALADSRFFPEAAALAIHWGLPPSERIREISEYARWTRQLTNDFDEEYRQRALGKVDTKRSQRHFREQCAELSGALNGGGAAKFDFDSFVAELGKKFGAVIRPLPENTNYGHIVEEQTQMVAQYDRQAQLRLIVLDSMVSNGFTSWLWDGRAAIGGWDTPASRGVSATILQVRGDQPVLAWESVNDPDALRRNRQDLARWATEDDIRANRNPYSYLPGLRLRMILRGRQRLLDRLMAGGAQGAELRALYMREFSRLTDAGTIFAHEGRHALDRVDRPYLSLILNASENLEYRAKLSEIAFAPDPLLAVGGIFYSNIGQKGDPHGMANQRIMKGLVNWMQEHGSEIKGLDRSRPFLPQFDLLTDKQMRGAFRSMDPWAPSGDHPAT